MAYAQNPIIVLLIMVLNLYWYIVLAAVVVSWLIAFNVINTYNHFARAVIRTLDSLTEPVFRQVRRILPSVGGFDLSPLVILLLLSWLIYSVLPWLDGHLRF